MTQNRDNSQAKKTFEGQRNNEDVLFLFRRHILVAKKGFFLFLILLLVFCSPIFIWPNNQQLLLVAVGGSLFGLVVLFYHLVIWYFTYTIVTDQRIRQFNQWGFFRRGATDLSLSKIQNISYSTPGVIADIIGYGTIIIQTLVGDLVIHYVQKPESVYNQLQNILDQTTGDD